MMDYLERKEKKESLIRTLQNGDWRSVLDAYDDEQYHEPLLVWIRPSLSLLEFLETELTQLGILKVLSIGCGCALLECLINHATSIHTRGLEVNSGWWESPHATPPFIHLDYFAAEELLPEDHALLFCYFNGMEAFEEYLAAYRGNCVVLIGPVDGRRHCAPEPFHLQGRKGWKIKACHDIRGAGQDNVVVYVRSEV